MNSVIYEKRDRIAYVTLNRPQAKNAIDPDTHERLWQVWEDFRDDDAVDVAIMTGTGDAFCAGADLKSYMNRWPGASPEAVRKNVDEGLGGITRGLHRIPKPIIAAVNGLAMGGGHTAMGRWANDSGVNAIDLLPATAEQPSGAFVTLNLCQQG